MRSNSSRVDINHTMQVERMRERSREVDLDRLVRWKEIDRPIRHETSGTDCAAENLKEHRNRRWNERDIVDCVVPRDRILHSQR